MRRKSRRVEQCSMTEEPANVRRSSRTRQSSVVANDGSDLFESEEQVSRKNPIRRCNNKKKLINVAAEHEQELPLLTFGQEMAPAETGDGLPVVELPSSPEEEKPKCDLLFLHEPKRTMEDRQQLLTAASVFKSELVARLKSSADNLSTSEMKILASKCYDVLELLGDNYTSFHGEVKKLIAQHQKVESAAKDKEAWNEWDMKASYIDQAQCLCKVRQKLSMARKNLYGAKTKIEYLVFKKEEMTDALRKLTEELYEEEERVKSLTQEADQFLKTSSEIEVGLVELDAKKKKALLASETYNASKGEFQRMSDQLLQLLKEK